jgi:hypothetical protein
MSQETFNTVMEALGKLPGGDLPYPLKDVLAKHKAAQKKFAETADKPSTTDAAAKPKSAGCTCPACQLFGSTVWIPEPDTSVQAPVVSIVPLSTRPEWGLKEAIREFLLNAKDAESEFEQSPTIEAINIASNDGKEHLGIVITSPVTHLPLLALQQPHHGWQSQKGMYGRYGEGILTATAAILRTPGCSLSIVTGGVSYDAGISGASLPLVGDFVSFKPTPNADYQQGVQIQIDGVPKKVWQNLVEDFDWIKPPFKSYDATGGPDLIKTKRGNIRLAQTDSGRIWIRGFRLPQIFPLKYGYDFLDAGLTRDRLLDPSVDIAYECACIWADAFVNPKNKTKVDGFLSAVANSKYLDSMLLDHVIPLMKLANSDDILKAVEEIVVNVKGKSPGYKLIPYDSLTPDEQLNLNVAMAVLLHKHAPKMLQTIEIFEGINQNYQNTAAKVAINRKNLSDRQKTMASILSALAEFQSKFVDTKNAPPVLWAAIMGTTAIDRIWKELEQANALMKAWKPLVEQWKHEQDLKKNPLLDLALAT